MLSFAEDGNVSSNQNTEFGLSGMILSNYLLALRVFEYIKEKYPSLNLNKDAFLWGSQGCAFLLKAQRDEELFKAAELLCPYEGTLQTATAQENESQTAEDIKTLNSLCELAELSKNTIDISYALGFLTHYALSCTAHPFVMFGTDRLFEICEDMTRIQCRQKIVTSLDTILLRYEKQETPEKYPLPKCAPQNDTVMQHIAVIYTLLIKQRFNIIIEMDDVMEIETLFCKELKDCNDPLGFKKNIVLRKEKKRRLPKYTHLKYRSVTEDDRYDYSNVSKKVWMNGETERTEDFFELFEHAYKLAVRLVDAFQSKSPFEDILKSYII